jgi:hypothetical protein
VRPPGGADAGKDATFFSHNILTILLWNSSRIFEQALFLSQISSLIFPGKLLNQANNFIRFRVAPGLELGVDQLPIYADLETASTRRNQGHAFNLRFKIRKQIVSQANGLGSVVSSGAINDLNF